MKLEVTRAQAIAIWHYFNAGIVAQEKFDDAYHASYGWKAAKFKESGNWYDIDRPLKSLKIDPRTERYEKRQLTKTEIAEEFDIPIDDFEIVL